MRDILVRAQANLARAVSDAAANELPPAGERWEAYAHAVRDQFESLLTPAQAIHFAQNPDQHGGFELRESSAQLRHQVATHESVLAAEFPQFADHIVGFEESPFSDPAF